MVRKQIYIDEAQERALLELANRLKISPAELIRKGIEQLLLREIRATPASGRSRDWDRESLHCRNLGASS